jgi:hypothetical protein
MCNPFRCLQATGEKLDIIGKQLVSYLFHLNGNRRIPKYWLDDTVHIVGSSSGSLVAISDCKSAVPGSNQAISLPKLDFQSLDWLPSRMVFQCRLSSLRGRGAEENTYKKGLLVLQKQLRQKL